jgi:hypothetical protein
VRRGERFRIRGSRLSCIAAGAPGGDREFGIAGSFNSRPFNPGSNFKLENIFEKNSILSFSAYHTVCRSFKNNLVSRKTKKRTTECGHQAEEKKDKGTVKASGYNLVTEWVGGQSLRARLLQREGAQLVKPLPFMRIRPNINSNSNLTSSALALIAVSAAL